MRRTSQTALAIVGALLASSLTFGPTPPVSATPTLTTIPMTNVSTGSGTAPLALAVTPNGARVYIANSGNSTVGVLNTTTNTITTTITLAAGTAPRGIAITPDGAKAYVTNNSNNTVSVIDTGTNTITATISGLSAPQGIAITPNGTRAYVTNSGTNEVSVIDTTNNTITATITDFSAPQGIAITPNGAYAYVTNNVANTVSVINTTSNTITATITDMDQPIGVAISTNGSYAYVSESSGAVTTIATATNSLVGGVNPFAGALAGITVSPDGGRIFSAGSSTHVLAVLSTGERVSCLYPYSFPGGAGTVASPYQIASQSDLNATRYCPSSAFVQTVDISLSGSWTPIGTTVASFTGAYDGAGHAITGLLIDGVVPGQPAGLFGRAQGAAFRDLRIPSGQVDVTGGDAGLLVGTCEECQVSSVDVTGSMTVVGGNAGGLAGQVSGATSTVSQASSAAVVRGQFRAGGLIGLVSSATISDSCATGSVTGTTRVGGLVGDANNAARLTQTCATGTVSGTRYVGGLVGLLAGGSDPDRPVPGMAAYIDRSFASGNVIATDSTRAGAGGLVGANWSTILDIDDPDDIAIGDTFATGSVTGVGVVGGLVGESASNGITRNSYAVGAVNGADNNSTGGVEGNMTSLDERWYSSVHWNIQTTGRTFGVGGSGATVSGLNLLTITSLTTAQMRSSSSFTGWDFTSVWGYQCGVSTTPELRWANPLATATSAGTCPSPDPGPSTPSSPTATPSVGQPAKETPANQIPPSGTALPPGSASMLIGGQPVVVQQTPQRRGQGIELTAGPVSFQLRSQTPSGRSVPTSPDGSLVIARPGTLPITGDGLLPGSLITQTLNSDPIDLGTTTVGTGGTFSSDTSIPASMPKGDHTFILTGTTKNGDPFTLAIGVEVTSPAAALGASPIVTTTPAKLTPGGQVNVKATGVQARCTVTFTLGKDKTRTTANARGIAVATLTTPPKTRRTVPLRTTVSGKGCEPVTVTRSLRR